MCTNNGTLEIDESIGIKAYLLICKKTTFTFFLVHICTKIFALIDKKIEINCHLAWEVFSFIQLILRFLEVFADSRNFCHI